MKNRRRMRTNVNRLEFRMLKNERFLARIAEARADIKAGRFTLLEDLPH